MLLDLLWIPAGLLYANGAEWFLHKFVLHGLGKHKKSPWAFHWHEHHRTARKNGHLDGSYHRSVFGFHSQGKEALGIVVLLLSHAPLAPLAPVFYGTLVYSALNYYRVHRRAHLDPDWAREHLTWHYDHHMGPNQDANWCVTRPWFDHILGTREPFAFTGKERREPSVQATGSVA
jgi:hypothetical protein